ncbi:MAG: bacteriophage holin [Alphaproteobacteria bacterium]|nr:bacteriophage holin [Alphaproteobacteria bacterium]
MERLKIIPLAVAFGAVWALGVLFLAFAAAFGWGTALVELLASLYLGYEASFLGGVIGALWAFVDGAIAGALIALVYNLAAGKPKAA